jgi:NAD(P)-dependent dehydrogenase (short-subunit alcohol dehydrogenase family)
LHSIAGATRIERSFFFATSFWQESFVSYSIDLSGRVAFVTGASSGLGAQFARALARAGAGVVLASRRVERLKDLRAQIEAEGEDAHVVTLDVTSMDSIRAAVAHAETEMGSIDILVNNSGVSTTQRLQDVGEEDFDFVFDTNVKGAFFVAQEVGKRMIARARGAAPGTFTGGRIINIASMAGLKALPQIGVYAMSKAAVVHMTKAMALEWGRFGINVNAICPGYIDTEINHHHWDTEQGRKLLQMLPRKRVGQPDWLDALIVMLASNESHFINGAVIAADDGFGV